MNLIRRPHELDPYSLHQHATEEEDFGGGRSIHVTSTTVGANEWCDGRCQTECEGMPDVSNEPNLLYVAQGPPFIR